MRYTPRDLRAADIFAAVLVGFGVVLLAFGSIAFLSRPDYSSPAIVVKSPDGKVIDKPKMGLPDGVAVGVCGFTLACLGSALSFKVRQLKRSGGVEPGESRQPAAS